MNTKYLLACCAFCQAICSSNLRAVSFDDLIIESNLNEPLSAWMYIEGLDHLRKDQVVIGVALVEDFQRMGLQRPPFLNDVMVEVEKTAQGKIVALLKSRIPIESPRLSVLLELQWPAGRILEDFEIRLSNQSLVTTQPSRPSLAGAVKDAKNLIIAHGDKADPANPTHRSLAPINPTPASTAQFVTVEPGETLWRVAMRVRPSATVSMPQVLWALQAFNTDVFINGDVHRLEVGTQLRVPSIVQMLKVDEKTARKWLKDKNKSLSEGVPLSNTHSTPYIRPVAVETELMAKCSCYWHVQVYRISDQLPIGRSLELDSRYRIRIEWVEHTKIIVDSAYIEASKEGVHHLQNLGTDTIMAAKLNINTPLATAILSDQEIKVMDKHLWSHASKGIEPMEFIVRTKQQQGLLNITVSIFNASQPIEHLNIPLFVNDSSRRIVSLF